jgi:hypothetical protein
MTALIYNTTSYFKNLLTYHDIEFSGESQYRVTGFDRYNSLVDTNACFSTSPSGDIVDRTNTIKMPWNMWVQRPWIVPVEQPGTLDECFQQRVNELLSTGQQLNLFWSGGIDSTSMLVGFLNHCSNLKQIRVLYSTNSIKENPNFFLILEQHPNIEMVEFSGDVYLEQDLDGLFISADGADDITASLDDSFYARVGYQGLQSLWPDYFYKQTGNSDLIDSFDQFCQASGRTIYTILEARWWFYTATKIQKFPSSLSGALQDHQPLPIGFYDCYVFEHYMFYNLDKIIPNKNYNSYKQFLKDYIYKYDRNTDYQANKQKVTSEQLNLYKNKKQILQNKQYIMLLSDGTRIRTPNLPFLSKKEYRQQYGDKLNYLFNV